MGEVGEGVVEAPDVQEKVLILEDGNEYLPVPLEVLPAVVEVVVEVVVVVVLLLTFDIIDFCKFPDSFFFNPPVGKGGNAFSVLGGG